MIIEEDFDKLFDNFKKMLIEKNKRYGNSALEPINIFSKTGASNQICNRIDDKISRIQVSDELRKNDICDLFGYLALLMMQKNWLEFDDQID